MDNNKPIVSVCIISYNQEKYILDALYGVRMQKTNFPFEVVISDDSSSDNTNAIICKFKEENPQLNVRYTHQEKNLGMIENVMFALKQCKGKYIAMCEGDDYWTDENKLQRQVDYLENHDDYTICFHPVTETINEENAAFELNAEQAECDFTIEQLAKGNFIHTPSIVFRNVITAFPPWFIYSPVGDYVIWMLLAEKGKIHYLPEKMAIYRRGVGCWTSNYEVINTVKWMQVLCFLKDYFIHNMAIYDLLCKQLEYNRLHAKKILDQDQFFINEGRNEIKLLKDELTTSRQQLQSSQEQLQSLNTIIQSAKDWQSGSWWNRAFHKWRPSKKSTIK